MQVRVRLEPERYYHVYNHANGQDVLFREPENYRYFLAKYAEYLHPVLDTFAYCLMPNHFHLLVRIRPEAVLQRFVEEKFASTEPSKGFRTLTGLREFPDQLVSRQFSHFFNGYTQAFNRQHNRRGSLLMPNFKRKEVTNDGYFTRLVYYIHANPVHHGYVRALADWPHSSYESVLSAKMTRLRKDEVLEWFGGRDSYRHFHRQFPDAGLPLEMDF
jgi:putative transposase